MWEYQGNYCIYIGVGSINATMDNVRIIFFQFINNNICNNNSLFSKLISTLWGIIFV